MFPRCWNDVKRVQHRIIQIAGDRSFFICCCLVRTFSWFNDNGKLIPNYCHLCTTFTITMSIYLRTIINRARKSRSRSFLYFKFFLLLSLFLSRFFLLIREIFFSIGAIYTLQYFKENIIWNVVYLKRRFGWRHSQIFNTIFC